MSGIGDILKLISAGALRHADVVALRQGAPKEGEGSSGEPPAAAEEPPRNTRSSL